MEKKENFKSGFVAIIGRPNVGKSTLLNRILGQKIAITSAKPQTTRNRILGIAHKPEGQILFLDTPGVHQARGRLNRFMVDQAMTACDEVDLVFYLVDATAPLSGGRDEERIFQRLQQSGRPVFLVINKIDAVSREALLPMIAKLSEKFAFAEVIPVSALTGDGVERLTALALERLPQGPAYYPEDMVTDLPERFIVGEMVREQLLRRLRDEVPFLVAVVIEEFREEPERNLVVIHAAINVARDSHKSIVVGKGGIGIREIGKGARHEIEKFLGCRVFLELFVKVERDWTESARHLREFGYHNDR